MLFYHVFPPVSKILLLPKAGSRKNTNKRRKTGLARILTDITVRNKIEKSKETRTVKEKAQKKTLENIANKNALRTLQESSDEDDSAMPIPLTDSSDSERGFKNCKGDFVVVNIRGKSCVVPYIARIDLFEDKEFEGVFSKKILKCGNFDKVAFVIDDADQASFAKTGIACKPRQPHIMGGSARKSQQLYFSAICLPSVCKNCLRVFLVGF